MRGSGHPVGNAPCNRVTRTLVYLLCVYFKPRSGVHLVDVLPSELFRSSAALARLTISTNAVFCGLPVSLLVQVANFGKAAASLSSSADLKICLECIFTY